jgi:hypothetical protein
MPKFRPTEHGAAELQQFAKRIGRAAEALDSAATQMQLLGLQSVAVPGHWVTATRGLVAVEKFLQLLWQTLDREQMSRPPAQPAATADWQEQLRTALVQAAEGKQTDMAEAVNRLAWMLRAKIEPAQPPSAEPSEPPVKRGRGRPRKHPLTKPSA